MFYHIEGIVSELGQNLAVLDCGGLGFALNVTANTLSRLKKRRKGKALCYGKHWGNEFRPLRLL